MVTVEEFRHIHTIFQSILQNKLEQELPRPQEVGRAMDAMDAEVLEHRVPLVLESWLALLDMAVNPHLFRNHLATHDVGDAALGSLVRFIVGKKVHRQDDHEKVDWLATHLFRKREENKKRPSVWPKTDIKEILEGFEFPQLSRSAEDLLMEMPALLDEVKYFSNFSQLTDSRIIQRAREMKNQFREEFFHPDVLAAVINYNLFFGQKFNTLIQEAMDAVREFARQQPNEKTPDTEQLLQSDYRLTSDALRSLSELGRQKALEQAGGPDQGDGQLAGQPPSIQEQLRSLGVDTEQEDLSLRKRMEELALRVRGNPKMNSIPNSFAPILLSEWELHAFQTPRPESEQSFRADSARSLCRSIGIIYRIHEEMPQYLEKKGTEFLWKGHYDSLVYLLYQGRAEKEVLVQLSASGKERGLSEKAHQLQTTSEKLGVALAKVAELF